MSVRRYDSRTAMYAAAAEYIVGAALDDVASEGQCTIALAGGATPQPFYECLSRPPLHDRMPWSAAHFFWSDERVSANAGELNCAMARDALLGHVPIDEGNIHRPRTELGDVAAIAEDYEQQMRAFFASGSAYPAFDIMMLGMGEDGHVASLFPGETSLQEHERWVVPVEGAHTKPSVPRITFTLPVINSARRVVFLMTGKRKMAILDEIVRDPEKAAKRYPAAMAQPEGELTWFVSE